MTATRRARTRRYSREQTQEDRSEAQLRARLAEVGWPCDRLGRDLGEDLRVRIYDDGVSTGLAFDVQLKSVASLEMIRRKKRTPPDRVAYRLEVKDLLHWEVSTTLVVLVLWDVEDETGWWRPIPEIVKELDEVHQGWREQRTVAVTVSMESGTNDEGLQRLRWAVIDHHLPLVVMYEALDRLSKSPAVQNGYFVRADARAAGAGDAVFEALLSEHKVEEIAPDVFHLAHFPRSDNEDLVALWLQTDRKGVISHDTALLLHELSDILPRRRHVTVPPGWGARDLGPNVVLYHAEIGEDEIRWLGPVPYTAPLRTVRDCIEAHLAPDLVEQAIAEGIERGMFTKDDFPAAPRRGAA